MSRKFFGVLLVALLLLVGSILLPLPKPLIDTSKSYLIYSQNKKLLEARVAKDEQWRFDEVKNLLDVDRKYIDALLFFEDKRFYSHIGVDPKAILRAFYLNLKAKRVVSGGSTITMQLSRIALKNQKRTVLQKLKEIWYALRIERTYTKDEILRLYISNTPFGGNTVGIESASYRYFGRSPKSLSWAEASLLAVLPNSPSLLHLKRARDRLKQKRDKLLKRLCDAKYLSKTELEASILEPLPHSVVAMPHKTRALFSTLKKSYKDKTTFYTTIDAKLQEKITKIAKLHSRRLAKEGIYNISALVVDNKDLSIKGYIGNLCFKNSKEYAPDVDITQSHRSTGSTLKPLLYGVMLDDGLITPKSLIPDIPSYFGSYAPTNFSGEYTGAVTAEDVIIKSLNIPSVRMIKEYGFVRFYHDLKDFGFLSLKKDPKRYGLSLILGSSEITLKELVTIYTNISLLAKSGKKEVKSLKLLQTQKSKLLSTSPLSQASAYLMLEAMSNLHRDGIDRLEQLLGDTQKIAWKTGTSYGQRDGWAVGVTPNYTVGVWVGNAKGKGSKSLTGTKSASPLMFDLFRELDGGGWFKKPEDKLKEIEVCKDDGYISDGFCKIVTIQIPKEAPFSKITPYHKRVFLDKNNFQVHSRCEEIENMRAKEFFTLPPLMASYYKKHHISYEEIPPFREDCQTLDKIRAIKIVYPQKNHNISLPKELSGEYSKVVLKVSHKDEFASIYWYIDEKFIKETTSIHQLPVYLQKGKHTLSVIDKDGNYDKREFLVE